MTDAPRGGRRFVFALAASLLVHAGAAAFIGVLPIGGGGEEAPVVEDRVEKLLRPVQITFVPMWPRKSIPTLATTPALPATDPPSAPDRDMAKAEPPPPPQPAPPPEPKPPTPPETLAVTPAVKPRAAERDAEPPAPSPPSPAPTQECPATTPAAPAIASTTRGPSSNPGKTARRDSRPGPSPSSPAQTPSTTGGSTANRPPGQAAATKDSTSKSEPGAAGPGARGGVEIVTLPTPEYPPRSRRLGEEGLVLLEVEVLPDGRAGTVRVLQAPDYPRLVDAAIEAVRSAAFRPATADGRPVRAFVEVPIRFRLD
jgi:protein TonB